VRHRLPPDVLLLATVVFWSFNFTAMKYALTHGFAPLVLSAVRYGAGAAIFSAAAYGREGTIAVSRRDRPLVLLAAAVGIWGNQIAVVYALRHATAATVALLLGTLPVFVAVFSRLAGHERLTFRQLAAAAISFSGVALVALGSGGGVSAQLAGVLLGVATAATWAAYSVAIAPLMKRYSPYRISAAVLLVGCLPLFLSASPQLADQDWSRPDALAWAGMAYALVFALVVTNVLWFTAIDRVGATRSSLYANLQPFLGAVFALVVLSERIGLLQIAGGVVIGAGIVLARSLTPPAAGSD
jgi:drug/metabolite transporter (DMT)-like permease